MHTSFTVRNYRCFTDLTIEPLERINLIAGKNNIGKTALLEALWLHKGFHNPRLGVNVNVFRGHTLVSKDEFLWSLFRGFEPDRIIELSSRDPDNQLRTLHITTQEHPTSVVSLRNGEEARENAQEPTPLETIRQETTQPAGAEIVFEYTVGSGQPIRAHATVERDSIRFEPARGVKEPDGVFLPGRRPFNPEGVAERLSKLAVVKKKDKIIRMMKIVEPLLQDLSVEHRGGTMIYGDLGGERLIPLPLLGDGTSRFLEIAVAIPIAQNGILLVDEIENGLHYSIMGEVWRAIADWAQEYTVQVFATTHSWECIKAAHDVFSASESYGFCLHRLDRTDDEIQAVTLSRNNSPRR